MYWHIIISALALGTLSSFHCLGMCGAIAFSLPTNHLSPAKKMAGIFLYNAGRIGTYAFLGLLCGMAGRQISIAGFQQTFSIIAGIVILALLVQSFFKKSLLHIQALDKFNIRIQQFIVGHIQHTKMYGMLLLGAGNGLLPCGMVYLAITGALASGSIANGTLFMAAFGFGTFPAMFLISWFGFVISISARNKIKKLVPWFVGAMAVLLIMRGFGLDLGMHHASAAIPSAQNAVTCP